MASIFHFIFLLTAASATTAVVQQAVQSNGSSSEAVDTHLLFAERVLNAITSLNASLQDMKNSINALDEKVSALDEKVSALAKNVTAMSVDVSEIKGSMVTSFDANFMRGCSLVRQHWRT